MNKELMEALQRYLIQRRVVTAETVLSFFRLNNCVVVKKDALIKEAGLIVAKSLGVK